MFLNEFLGERRLALHVSLADVARRAGVSKSAWHGIERGKWSPQLGTLITIGSIMGFEVVILSDRQALVARIKDCCIELEPSTDMKLKNLHAMRALSALTPEQAGIVAKAAALLRP